ncbi:MAG: helix-turn-helix domain-containing protein [Boseongicola sp.]|nr:helix-turn-helix domain-containing protein [Boseongicola sp.]
MAERVLVGTKIRRIRKALGVRQTELALRCDISPSYLNLIEHNRRAIAGGLLSRVATALKTSPEELSGESEAAVINRLNALGLPSEQTGERSEELAARFPMFANHLVSQADRIAELEGVVETLTDRLVHDPYLSASLHNILSVVTAIRSTSTILAEGESIEPEWTARFHRNLHEDSRRLAGATESLVNYLDAEPERQDRRGLPLDEAMNWWSSVGAKIAAGDTTLSDASSSITDAPDLPSQQSKELARRIVAQQMHDEETIPLGHLRDRIGGEEPDPSRLAQDFQVPISTILRRLAALSGDTFAGGVRPALIECDDAGAFTFNQPTRGIEASNYSAGCARLPIFRALRQPGVPIKETIVVEARESVRFTTFAIAEALPKVGFDGPTHMKATMLLLPSFDGSLDQGADIRIGLNCRVCPIQECDVRREPSIIESGSENVLTVTEA